MRKNRVFVEEVTMFRFQSILVELSLDVFSHFCVMIPFSVPYGDVFLFGCSGGAVRRELISSA